MAALGSLRSRVPRDALSGSVIALQRAAGNRAVARLVGDRLRSPVPIQRTIWIYGSEGFWDKEKKDPVIPGQPVSRPQPPVTPVGPDIKPGDTFDDSDPLLRVYTGKNAKTLGEPNEWIGYQAVSPGDDVKMRAGLALAKAKLARGLAAVKVGVLNARAGQPVAAQVVNAMEVAFNIPTDVDPLERLQLLEILEAGLERLRAGLDQENLPLISATRMRMYGVYDEPADCSGWVPRGLTEMFGRGKKASDLSDLREVSGDIHLRSTQLGDPNFVADTIIHEAAHKFLGAWDYSYVGVQGAVGTGLANRAASAASADPNLSPGQARVKAKSDSVLRAHAQLVQKLVANGLKSLLPEALDRGRPVAPTDSPAVVAAKRVWAMVRNWGAPDTDPPDPDVLTATISALSTKGALPRQTKAELAAFLQNKERYLAEKGNELDVKGHDVLFALSTGFLLKNADSWTEMALTAGT